MDKNIIYYSAFGFAHKIIASGEVLHEIEVFDDPNTTHGSSTTYYTVWDKQDNVPIIVTSDQLSTKEKYDKWKKYYRLGEQIKNLLSKHNDLKNELLKED